jgi:hypothetical protein
MSTKSAPHAVACVLFDSAKIGGHCCRTFNYRSVLLTILLEFCVPVLHITATDELEMFQIILFGEDGESRFF